MSYKVAQTAPAGRTAVGPLGDLPLAAWAAICVANNGTFNWTTNECCPAGTRVQGPWCLRDECTLSWYLRDAFRANCVAYKGRWDEERCLCLMPFNPVVVPDVPTFLSEEGGTLAACPSGTVRLPDRSCMPYALADTQAPTTPGEQPEPGWWQRQSDTTKVLIVGGAGIGALFGAAWLVGRRKRV
jgi:hypothetical protein